MRDGAEMPTAKSAFCFQSAFDVVESFYAAGVKSAV